MERAGQYVLVLGSKLAKGIWKGLFIFGVVDTISSIKNDWNDSKNGKEKAGKIAIDASVFIFSTIAGAVGSPAAGAVVGFGLSTIGDSIKNYYGDN